MHNTNEKSSIKIGDLELALESEHPVGCNAHPIKLSNYHSPEMVHKVKDNRKGFHFKTDVWYITYKKKKHFLCNTNE